MYAQQVTNLKKLEKVAIEKGIELACKLSLYKDEFSGSEKKVTKNKLSNMLKAAYMAEKIGSYRAFEVSVAYLARDTDRYDELNWFVRKMIMSLREMFRTVSPEPSEEDKIKVAKKLIETLLMVFSARQAGINTLCLKRR